MRRSSLITIIAMTLIGFILFKGAASLLCDPTKPNSVANVISEVVSNVSSEPAPIKDATKPDPLSWDPIIHRMMGFFSKACPR